MPFTGIKEAEAPFVNCRNANVIFPGNLIQFRESAGFGHRVNVARMKMSLHSKFDDGRFALEAAA